MKLLTLALAFTLVGCATEGPRLEQSSLGGVEVVLAGRVHEVLLLPVGHERCPSRCESEAHSTAGDQALCFSNTCGCDETTILVSSESVREFGARQAVLSHSLGEWCISKLLGYSDGFFLLRNAGVLHVASPIDPKNLDAGPNLNDMDSLGNSADLEPKSQD